LFTEAKIKALGIDLIIFTKNLVDRK